MKANLRACWSVTLSLFSIQPALAQDPNDITWVVYISGESLTEYCRSYLAMVRNDNRPTSSQQAFEAGQCLGLVTGTIESTSSDRSAPLPGSHFCFSTFPTHQSATEIVARFVDAHPELRTQPGDWLIRKALAEAFPCG